MNTIKVYSDSWWVYKDYVRRYYNKHYTNEIVNIIYNDKVIGQAERHVCHRDGVRITNIYGGEI